MKLIEKIRHKRQNLKKPKLNENAYNSKQRVADAFNILYQSVVNKTNPATENEYDRARSFVNMLYPVLDTSVLGYLSMYMQNCPNGKIEFIPSKEACVGLICNDNGSLIIVSFETSGSYVMEERVVQKEI